MKYAGDLRILEAPVSHYLSDFSTGDKPQQAQVVSPREPVVVKLEDFFRIADSVVLLKVVSGDTENYSTAIYKAEVLRSFKGGTAARAAIYFRSLYRDETRRGLHFIFAQCLKAART
jgi:hypothetical protein